MEFIVKITIDDSEIKSSVIDWSDPAMNLETILEDEGYVSAVVKPYAPQTK